VRILNFLSHILSIKFKQLGFLPSKTIHAFTDDKLIYIGNCIKKSKRRPVLKKYSSVTLANTPRSLINEGKVLVKYKKYHYMVEVSDLKPR